MRSGESNDAWRRLVPNFLAKPNSLFRKFLFGQPSAAGPKRIFCLFSQCLAGKGVGFYELAWTIPGLAPGAKAGCQRGDFNL